MILLVTSFSLAQNSTGRLVGTVSGPDGVLPGATVDVTFNQTGKKISILTNDEGGFAVPALDVGNYTVTVTSSGFKTYTAENLKIDVAREYTLNITLEIGAVAENVTVTAGADLVNASGADLSSTVSPRQVLELPLNGRNPLSLIGLQAGAGQNRGNGSEIINGSRTSTTNFTRDGLNVADVFIRNGASTDNPSVDNTGEFTVITGNAGAEFGYGSSQVQLVTPRGGRDFHGALWIYNRNSVFGANSFFNNAAGQFLPTDQAVIQGRATAGDDRTPRAFLNRNQFGGKVSGPLPLPYFGEGTPVILKNKAFFFFSTERLRQSQQFTATRTIFRPDARNGIFSYRPVGTPAAGECITFSNGVCTVNVLNGNGAVGGSIPASAQGNLPIDPVIANRFLSNIPTSGNRADIGDGLNTIGLSFNQSAPSRSTEYTGRIDADINDRNAVFGVYRFNDVFQPVQDTSYGTNFAVNYTAPAKSINIGWNTTLSSNFTNSLRGGYVDAPVAFANDDLSNAAFILAIPLVNGPENTFRDQGRFTSTLNFSDNATYVFGNHTFRFGADMQRVRVLAYNLANVGIPTYSISTTSNSNTPPLQASLFPGGISNANLATANSLRYLLAGIVGSGSVAANVTDVNATSYTPGARLDRNIEYKTYSGYFSDQWRFRPNLTFNLGVRYEYYTPLRSRDGLYLEPVLGDDVVGSILNPNGTYQFVGGNAGEAGNFAKPDRDNFGPVANFSWSPTGKGLLKYLTGDENRTVIRGGYRMSYVNDEYIKSQDNANFGNVGLSATANALFNGTVLLNDRASSLTAPTAPAFVAPPFNYLTNNQRGGNFGTVFAVDPNLQVTRQHEFNIGLQREIGFDTAIEIRYVRTRSNSLVRTIDFNQIDIRNNNFGADFIRALNNNRVSGSINGNAACLANGTCQALTVIPNLTTAGRTAVQNNITLGTPAELALTLIQGGNTGSVRFLPNPNTGVANILTNGGLFKYDGLQTEVRRRFTQGLALQANYTFSKILSNIPDDGINQNRVNPYLDNANQALEYSRTPYDTTHSFNFNAIYELPFGKGRTFLNRGGIVDKLIGGWQLGNIVQITSGPPILISDVRGTLNRSARSGTQTAYSPLSKDQIKDLLGFRNINGTLYYIDPAVTSAQGRAAEGFGSTPFTGQVFFNVDPLQTGNIERYAFNGPMFWNWDANLIKNISVSETVRVQLRAEAFNLTNSAQFQVPTFAIGSANFGKITSTRGSPRIMQFAFRFEF